MTKPTIRKYQPGDEQEINQLYNTVFGTNRSLTVWHWKYAQGPCAQPELVQIMEHDGQIIGQYSALILPMIYNGQTMIEAQATDIAIHDAYQGRRFSKSLFDAWISMACAVGVTFIFGFPNAVHYRAGKKAMNFGDIGPMMLMRRYVNPGLSLFKLTKLPITLNAPRRLANWLHRHLLRSRQTPSDLSIESLEHFDERFDAFWDQMSSTYPIMVARTRAYLNWRYVAHPDASYVIYAAHRDGVVSGYIVLTVQRGFVVQGLIADVLAVDATTTQILLERALTHFFTIGVDMISTWSLPDSQLYNTLRWLKFVQRRVAAPLAYVIFDHDTIDESFLCDPCNWYVTMGDSDGV